MDRKTYATGILSVSALVMFTALLLTPDRAPAGPVGTVVRERDWTMMTAASQTGGDALYVVDNRNARIAVLTFDNNSRSMSLRATAPISDAFTGMRPAAGGGR